VLYAELHVILSAYISMHECFVRKFNHRSLLHRQLRTWRWNVAS